MEKYLIFTVRESMIVIKGMLIMIMNCNYEDD